MASYPPGLQRRGSLPCPSSLAKRPGFPLGPHWSNTGHCPTLMNSCLPKGAFLHQPESPNAASRQLVPPNGATHQPEPPTREGAVTVPSHHPPTPCEGLPTFPRVSPSLPSARGLNRNGALCPCPCIACSHPRVHVVCARAIRKALCTGSPSTGTIRRLYAQALDTRAHYAGPMHKHHTRAQNAGPRHTGTIRGP